MYFSLVYRAVFIYTSLLLTCGPGSVVGIATGYGLDGSEIESRWGGEIFRTCPDRPWGPPSLLYNGYRVFPGGKEQPGRDTDPSLPSSAVVMKRYSYTLLPYGPYGLYRASVPVKWCTLPYLTAIMNNSIYCLQSVFAYFETQKKYAVKHIALFLQNYMLHVSVHQIHHRAPLLRKFEYKSTFATCSLTLIFA